jgi:hypothetical protein
MADNINVEEIWHTELRCTENDHHYTDDIMFFAPLVGETNPEPDEFRPNIADKSCPYGDSPVEVVRRLYRVD